MRKAVISLFLLLLIVPLVQTVNSTSIAPDYLIQVQHESAIVSFSFHAFQNFTSFAQFQNFSLPQFQVLAAGSNATSLGVRLEDALRTKRPEASLSNLQFEATTSAWNGTSKRQWLNITTSFTVSGIAESEAGGRTFDLSWKSVAVASNVTLGGYEVNRLGEAYFESIAQTLSRFHFTSETRFFLRVNGQSMVFSLFPSAVAGVTALNFTALNTPLSQWQLTHVPLADVESYDMAVRGLGLSFERAIIVPAEQTESITYYGLFYDIQGQIDVPSGSHVKGDFVKQDSNVPETIMGGVILSALLLGSGTYLYEKRLVKTPFRKRPKR